YGLDFSRAGRFASKKEYWAIMALAKVLSMMDIFPLEAFKEAVAERAEFSRDNLEAIEAGVGLEV
ncbi:MAG: hypothetical protein ACM3H7_06280, partial [Acidobacteriaceae bacterium]